MRLLTLLLGITAVTVNVLDAEQKPGQVPTSSPLQFEVASVKLNKSGRDGRTAPISVTGDRFAATNAPLISLLQFAYQTPNGTQLRTAEISGAPSWAGFSDGFDIEAKAAGPVSTSEIRFMLQSLLADRFQLKAHWEIQVASVYALIIAKDGLRLKPSTTSGKPQLIGMPPTPGGGFPLMLTNPAMSIADLCTFLQGDAGRRVKDETTLNGFFDVTLQFTFEPLSPSSGTGNTPPSDPSGPSIFTAVQEQLGLKLESSKAPVQVLVIDSVQKPRRTDQTSTNEGEIL